MGRDGAHLKKKKKKNKPQTNNLKAPIFFFPQMPLRMPDVTTGLVTYRSACCGWFISISKKFPVARTQTRFLSQVDSLILIIKCSLSLSQRINMSTSPTISQNLIKLELIFKTSTLLSNNIDLLKATKKFKNIWCSLCSRILGQQDKQVLFPYKIRSSCFLCNVFSFFVQAA